MKTFYSAEDIENLADQGRREVCIGDNIVLTDMAKQTAQMLGIRITVKSSEASPGVFTSIRAQSVGKTPALGGKPRGCQKRPANKSIQASTATGGQSRPVVDKLVATIKQINGKNR